MLTNGEIVNDVYDFIRATSVLFEKRNPDDLCQHVCEILLLEPNNRLNDVYARNKIREYVFASLRNEYINKYSRYNKEYKAIKVPDYLPKHEKIVEADTEIDWTKLFSNLSREEILWISTYSEFNSCRAMSKATGIDRETIGNHINEIRTKIIKSWNQQY